MRPTFTSLENQSPGVLADMLKRSYAALLTIDSQHWTPEVWKWEQFDINAFKHPETIGSCVFFSWVDEQLVGFGSYDPRKKPELGIVGHNCILPEFRRKGCGLWQLREILRRFAAMGIKKAQATTHEHAFFGPARRMYLACGFRETRRIPWDSNPSQQVIDYEKEIG